MPKGRRGGRRSAAATRRSLRASTQASSTSSRSLASPQDLSAGAQAEGAVTYQAPHAQHSNETVSLSSLDLSQFLEVVREQVRAEMEACRSPTIQPPQQQAPSNPPSQQPQSYQPRAPIPVWSLGHPPQVARTSDVQG